MLTVGVVLNVLCLAAVGMALWRLKHPACQADSAERFAHLLAAAMPVARYLIDREVWVTGDGLGSRPLGGTPDFFGAVPPERAATPREGGDTRGRSQTDRAEDERLAAGLALADRLAIVRRMLQGASVEEVAASTGIADATVRALYRLHGRKGAGTC